MGDSLNTIPAPTPPARRLPAVIEKLHGRLGSIKPIHRSRQCLPLAHRGKVAILQACNMTTNRGRTQGKRIPTPQLWCRSARILLLSKERIPACHPIRILAALTGATRRSQCDRTSFPPDGFVSKAISGRVPGGARVRGHFHTTRFPPPCAIACVPSGPVISQLS